MGGWMDGWGEDNGWMVDGWTGWWMMEDEWWLHRWRRMDKPLLINSYSHSVTISEYLL